MQSHLEGWGGLRVVARGYSLLVRPEGPWLEVRWAGGRVTLGGGAGEPRGRWKLSPLPEGKGEVALSSEDGRRLILECHEDYLYAQAELPEAGAAPRLLAGTGRPSFTRLFSPEPTALRRHLFTPEERAVAAVGSDPDFHQGHWFFSPPPFCFGLESDAGTLAVGVACCAAPPHPAVSRIAITASRENLFMLTSRSPCLRVSVSLYLRVSASAAPFPGVP